MARTSAVQSAKHLNPTHPRPGEGVDLRYPGGEACHARLLAADRGARSVRGNGRYGLRGAVTWRGFLPIRREGRQGRAAFEAERRATRGG